MKTPVRWLAAVELLRGVASIKRASRAKESLPFSPPSFARAITEDYRFF